MTSKIYLDHNATTPVSPPVKEAMAPFWQEGFGNPSSLHEKGSEAARAVREARRETTRLLNASDDSEIIFTSGGTESNNTALRSALTTQKERKRIVTTAVEHSSILKLAKALREEGFEVVFVPVDEKGNLDRKQFTASLTPETALVSIMTANNETGVIFPVEALGQEVRERKILFHVDAVQATGKIPVSLKNSAVDFLSLSAHKFGGPKGVGVLYVKKGVPFRPLLFGGAQERGRRAGTENVPGIVGMGRAARIVRENFDSRNQKIRELRDLFEKEILQRIEGVEINGDPKNRVPNTSNLFFEKVDAEALLILLDQEGIYASSGSACLSGAPEPSHVLKAMGFSDPRARSSVRFSFGAGNHPDEIDVVVGSLERFIRRLREIEFEEQHPHLI